MGGPCAIDGRHTVDSPTTHAQPIGYYTALDAIGALQATHVCLKTLDRPMGASRPAYPIRNDPYVTTQNHWRR